MVFVENPKTGIVVEGGNFPVGIDLRGIAWDFALPALHFANQKYVNQFRIKKKFKSILGHIYVLLVVTRHIIKLGDG